MQIFHNTKGGSSTNKFYKLLKRSKNKIYVSISKEDSEKSIKRTVDLSRPEKVMEPHQNLYWHTRKTPDKAFVQKLKINSEVNDEERSISG